MTSHFRVNFVKQYFVTLTEFTMNLFFTFQYCASNQCEAVYSEHLWLIDRNAHIHTPNQKKGDDKGFIVCAIHSTISIECVRSTFLHFSLSSSLLSSSSSSYFGLFVLSDDSLVHHVLVCIYYILCVIWLVQVENSCMTAA